MAQFPKKLKMNSNWKKRFMRLARETSLWSKDSGTQVGSVIVRPDKTIASVGFNGFPRNVNDSQIRIDDRDQKLLFTIHAELNAILSAKEPLNGYSIFVWPFQPCAQCAAALIQAGINQVYCPNRGDGGAWQESFKAALQMFDEAGVGVEFV